MALLGQTTGKFERVIIEQRDEGFYVLAYGHGKQYPARDHLQDDLAMAKLQALEDYGIGDDEWVVIPDVDDDYRA